MTLDLFIPCIGHNQYHVHSETLDTCRRATYYVNILDVQKWDGFHEAIVFTKTNGSLLERCHYFPDKKTKSNTASSTNKTNQPVLLFAADFCCISFSASWVNHRHTSFTSLPTRQLPKTTPFFSRISLARSQRRCQSSSRLLGTGG